MIRKILVGLDGSSNCERVLPWVNRLGPEAEIVLARIVESVNLEATGATAPSAFDLTREAERYLQKASTEHLPRAWTIVRQGPAVPTLLNVAHQMDADMIAITTHGGGAMGRRVFGGTAERLLHESGLPVFVVPAWPTVPRPTDKIEKVLVPVDGSAASEAVLPLAATLARMHGASLLTLHIVTEGSPQKIRDMGAHLGTQTEALRAQGIDARFRVIPGVVPGALIMTALDEGADLFVMSSHGHGSLGRTIFGSTATELMRTTPTPVVVANGEALKRIAMAVPETAHES